MGKARRQLEKRKYAKAQLGRVMDQPDHVIVIHYSCESFYERPDGSSPRITSIAVRNLGSGQTISFSIHQAAEIRGIPSGDIDAHYNDLEKRMLDGFYQYAREHSGYTWLHWNMRDINYGFQAISHRYRVLGGTPVDIPEALLFDLARSFAALYGLRYAPHPRLKHIVERNGVSHKDFLTGADEATAFQNKQYVPLHLSTLRKVDVLATLAERADQGSIRTYAPIADKWGLYPQAFGEWLKEHWVVSIVGAAIAIASLIIGLLR